MVWHSKSTIQQPINRIRRTTRRQWRFGPEEGWVTAPPCGAFSLPCVWTCCWSLTCDKRGLIAGPKQSPGRWDGFVPLLQILDFYYPRKYDFRPPERPPSDRDEKTRERIDFTSSLQNGFPMSPKYNVYRGGCLGREAENQGDHHAKLPAVMHSSSRSTFHSFDTLFSHSSPLSGLSMLYEPHQTNITICTAHILREAKMNPDF